ncbi:MAG: hypothetical protein ACI35P_12700, partial [Bacillus sp. (in: firmicutes)]
MKTIFKSILITLINFFALFILAFLMDNVDGLIAGKFYGSFDIRDWWYKQVSCHLVNYMMATSLISGLLFLIYRTIDHYITNRIRMMSGIVFGCWLVIVLNILYWKYIRTNCYGFEWSALEDAFMISYGSDRFMRLFWELYTCIILCVGLTVNHMELLILHPRKKTVWHQIFSSEDIFIELLYTAMPYGIFISGSWFIAGFMEIATIKIFMIAVCVSIAGCFWVKIRRFIALNQYYKCIEQDPEKINHLVIFQESPYVRETFIVRQLFGTGISAKIKANSVWFYPNELGNPGEIFIKLDIYDEWMFIRPKSEKENIIRCMSENRGTFNVAYKWEARGDYMKFYDGIFLSAAELSNELRKLDGYMDFRKKVNDELKHADLAGLTKSTCISDEIVGFKRYLMNQIDEFLVFDFAIKWLEIVNYLFALTVISKNEIRIS